MMLLNESLLAPCFYVPLLTPAAPPVPGGQWAVQGPYKRCEPKGKYYICRMPTISRTTATDAAFRNLVKLLDAHLAITDEDEHDFYHQYNGLEDIKHVVLLREGDQAVACGAIKQFDAATMEVKRMFTRPEARGKGLAGQVLHELEQWARELGYTRCVLETGIRQPYAIRLYEKSGYVRMPENYGQYKNVANSVCMEKVL